MLKPELPQEWWRNAVFYQIYPNSFADSNGDGVGDLAGICDRLEYLEWLGVQAIWLSPIFPSPMKDGGYDIQDYENINPLFGTLDDFDRLVKDAHSKNIKVLLDWVPNHTSDQHPWFLESRSSRDNPKRNWYIWRNEPNNWRSDLGGGSAWEYDEETKQYYLHSYMVQQPDLNWDNPEVVTAMLDVLSFWLARGVDGFRADTINMIAKDLTFANLTPDELNVDQGHIHDLPKIHDILKIIRKHLDTFEQKPVMIGELNLDDQTHTAYYYGHNDELQMLFNFKLCNARWDAHEWKSILNQTATMASSSGYWPSPVLGNHDSPRLLSRYGTLSHARVAAVMLTTLPGAPFLFAGDELGLENAGVTHLVDLGGRDSSRAPFPWTADQDHGWPQPHVLPFPLNTATADYQTNMTNKSSILWLYKNLLDLRKDYEDLRHNNFELIDSPPNVLAYRRTNLVVLINFDVNRIDFALNGRYSILISSDPVNTKSSYENTLNSLEALVLQKHD